MLRSLSDERNVNGFWADAASILETATAAGVESRPDIGILVSHANGLRIVDASGWNADSLRREYGASTVYTVKRSGGGVTVEAQSGKERATLSKALPGNPLASLMSTVPHHLVTTTHLLPEATNKQ